MTCRNVAVLFVIVLIIAGCGGSTAKDTAISSESPAGSTRATLSSPSPEPAANANLSPSPAPSLSVNSQPGLTDAQVVEVVDGDTIKVSINGGPTQTIRIIGIDTPETKDPRKPVMCYGAEATAKTQELIDVASGHVQLEKDVSETDKYDRLLRYVWLLHPDGERMLNEELVKGGYAQSSTYPPDVKYQDLFVAAQREAREQGRGLWGVCGSFGVPAATEAPSSPVAPAAPAQEPAAGGNCDPSYPGVCIPPPPPDLKCRDVPYRRFAVVPPDPHGFDGNNDGVGCEG